MRPKVVIAGATGFIGRWFMERYAHQYDFIALSRRQMDLSPDHDGPEWRQVELYSLSSTRKALRGADYAIYLVHSMQPSTRLSQSTFEDTDLLLADNFRRAAREEGIRQILFIGGILPKDTKGYSRHLRSRYEVEQTLSYSKVPLTSLRAGIIAGPGGSSFRIIEKLVNRLPVMVCPKWTLSRTQPISLDDTLAMMDYCLGNTDTYDQHYDIAGPEVTTYVDMMRTVADIQGKRRYIFTVPIFSLGLSKLWVSTFADSSTTLVSPLIESLRYELLARPNALLNRFDERMTFRAAAKRAVFEKDTIPQTPSGHLPREAANTVRSVQRLPNPGDQSAIWVARRYQTWLPKFFRYLIRVDHEGDLSTFRIAHWRLLRLRFVRDRSDTDRQLFYIVGGLLTKRRDYGWLEFRRVLGGKYFIAAIHEFVPTLPWYFYLLTQAIVHLWVMRRFGNYLERLKEDNVDKPDPVGT